MIYVCIPSHDEAPTVGLLLWKIRQVFASFPREYQLLVLDDGSTDTTAEVLERYTRVLELTDRPKRDAAILMHADFAHSPQAIPDLVRRIESGADLVVAEARLEGEPSRAHRLVRRYGPLLLRGVVSVAGVRDILSGYAILRLVVLRNA